MKILGDALTKTGDMEDGQARKSSLIRAISKIFFVCLHIGSYEKSVIYWK